MNILIDTHIEQEKDWETMDYDEYNEKYWGLIF